MSWIAMKQALENGSVQNLTLLTPRVSPSWINPPQSYSEELILHQDQDQDHDLIHQSFFLQTKKRKCNFGKKIAVYILKQCSSPTSKYSTNTNTALDSEGNKFLGSIEWWYCLTNSKQETITKIKIIWSPLNWWNNLHTQTKLTDIN